MFTDPIQTILCPCYGRVEKIFVKNESYVYEWEKLFIIRTNNDILEEVTIGSSGSIIELKVCLGEEVTPHTVLAILKDDFLITGSD